MLIHSLQHFLANKDYIKRRKIEWILTNGWFGDRWKYYFTKLNQPVFSIDEENKLHVNWEKGSLQKIEKYELETWREVAQGSTVGFVAYKPFDGLMENTEFSKFDIKFLEPKSKLKLKDFMEE